jgi:hypothetical protein
MTVRVKQIQMQNQEREELLSEHARRLRVIRSQLEKLSKETRFWHVSTLIESILGILLSLLGSIIAGAGVSFSFSNLLQIPKPYVYLIGIVLSSLVGISIIFLLARMIYRQRKREREAAIEGIRLKEAQLFKMFEVDFEEMVKRRELDAGSPIPSH